MANRPRGLPPAERCLCSTCRWKCTGRLRRKCRAGTRTGVPYELWRSVCCATFNHVSAWIFHERSCWCLTGTDIILALHSGVCLSGHIWCQPSLYKIIPAPQMLTVACEFGVKHARAACVWNCFCVWCGCVSACAIRACKHCDHRNGRCADAVRFEVLN